MSGGGGNVGGLVGSNQGTIADSYDSGAVTGEGSYVGGLVGSSRSGSAIASSYATGRVTGNRDVGGLIGDRHFISVADSYWDTQTTGQSRSEGGIYAGWNADWWDFGASRQYPALKYQGMDVAAQRRLPVSWGPPGRRSARPPRRALGWLGSVADNEQTACSTPVEAAAGMLRLAAVRLASAWPLVPRERRAGMLRRRPRGAATRCGR